MKYLILPFLFFCHLATAANSHNEEDLANRLRHHVSILASDTLQGRGLGTTGTERAREYISNEFTDIGLIPFNNDYLQAFDVRIGLAWVPAMNILGFLEGNDPGLKDEYIVIGAHYDHLGFTRSNDTKTIFPGADDNASGVAGILELARYFSEHRDQLKRSIIFIAFDAEESGLLGARHFVENCPVGLERIQIMFSLDMIGMYDSNRGVSLIGMGSLLGGKTTAQDIASRMDINIRSINNRVARRTDTAPFGSHSIPSVHVFTGTKSPYHKPEDTYEKLEYEGMAKVVLFMQALTTELSSAPALAPSHSLLASHSRESKGRKIGFGITAHSGAGFHRYEDQYFRAKPVYVAGLGVFSQIPVGKIFALQPELLYDHNGSKIDGGSFRRHSVTLPLNLQLLTPGSPASGRLFAFAGPYYRLSFGGRSAGEAMDFEQVFESNEWGLSLGAGIQVARIQISYTSRRGYTNLLQHDELKILDTNNYFTVSLRF